MFEQILLILSSPMSCMLLTGYLWLALSLVEEFAPNLIEQRVSARYRALFYRLKRLTLLTSLIIATAIVLSMTPPLGHISSMTP